MTRRENAQKMMFRKNNKIPNCPRPDFDKKNSDFRARGKWKSVVVTAYPTQDWGTRSDVKVGDHKAATLKLHKAI